MSEKTAVGLQGFGEYMRMAAKAPNPEVAMAVLDKHFSAQDALQRVKRLVPRPVLPATVKVAARRGAAEALAFYKAAALRRKTLGGLRFLIDRPKGTTKTWPGGRSWTYPVDYGYVPGTEGEDGEGVDAFVGDDADGCLEKFEKLKREDGRLVLDETKYLLGLDAKTRKKVLDFYGEEIGKVTRFDSWDDVRADVAKFRRSKSRYKTASRANAFARVTTEGPVSGEDRDYEHAMAHYKLALLGTVNDRETSADNVRVSGATLPTKLVDPPKAPAPPKTPKPIQVPQSSAPQVLKLSGDGFVAPGGLTLPDAGPDHARGAETAATRDLIDRFFRAEVDSRRNVAPNAGGVSESVAGALPGALT